jgi:hypothetical protein
MTLEDLLPVLLKLDRAEKLRAIQLLAHQLLAEDGAQLSPTAHYEVWSPQGAKAARQLAELLEPDKRAFDYILLAA